MTPYIRFATLAVIAVVAVGGTLMLVNQKVGSGGPPSASPTASPSPSPVAFSMPTVTPTVNLDTALWTTFTSVRYQYTIKVPPAWEAAQASRDWAMAVDRTDWLSPAQDRFIDQEAMYQIGVHVFRIKLAQNETSDQWIDAFLAGSACPVRTADMRAIVIDGQPGKVAAQPACDDSIAFVQTFERGFLYVITIGRTGQQPLFDAFLSTFRFS